MTEPERTFSRIFPVATPTIYQRNAAATTENERVGQAVLGLASGALPQLAGVAGFALSPVNRLGRLLMFHRLAIDAEMQQGPRRADGFWCEAIRQLEMLWRDDAVWREAIADQSIRPRAAQTALTPQGFREAVLRELFADTQWGFFQAHYRPDVDPDDRGFVHLEYLLQLATRISPLDAARTAALTRAVRDLVGICIRHKRWRRAEQVASILVERFGDGDEHQNLLATAMCRRAVDEMKDLDDEAAARHDAEQMTAAAAGLEKLRDRFGRNTLLFDLLGGIHFRQALALANSGQLAEALVAIQKALTFDPSLEGAAEAREELLRWMNDLRVEARTLEAKVAAIPNATLDEAGAQMVREAALGFEPLKAFIASTEAARIVADWRVAQGYAIWRVLGLSVEEASKEQILALYDVLASTLQRANGNPGDLESAWEAAIQQHTAAATVDRASVLDWVRRELDGSATEATAHTSGDAAWPCEVREFALERPQRQRDREPAAEWLFSSGSL